MADYKYTISTAFPNQAVAGDKLKNEINASSIASAPLELVNTDADSDECKIKFDGSLSGADETTLDGLVAAHDGVPYVDIGGDGLWVFSQADSSTTSSSWQQKCTLNLGEIQVGTYRIRWSFEWEVLDNDNEGGAFRITLNDSLLWQMVTFPIKKLHPKTESLIWYEVIDTPGTYHIDLEYHSENGRETVIRNATIDVRRA